jgi:hypothetical protein
MSTRACHILASVWLIGLTTLSSRAGTTDELIAHVLGRMNSDVPETMARRDGTFAEILHRPSARVLIGAIPQKKGGKGDCVGSFEDCALSSMAFCQGQGSDIAGAAYVAQKTDKQYPEGACAVKCFNGMEGKATMCGSAKRAPKPPACPCQDDPCMWGSAECCPGEPPKWCEE